MHRTSKFVSMLLVLVGSMWADTIVVPGSASPWLAGMPDGSTCCGGDSAPAQSPSLLSLSVVPFGALTFVASGGTQHGPTQPIVGAEGRPGIFTAKAGGAENGISGVTAQLSALMGVFLNDDPPALAAAPDALTFSGAGGMDFLTLAPALRQVFFIGDGRANGVGGATQRFIVPAGATRLFLGTMDGFEWNNNGGALNVTVSGVPEPSLFSAVGLAIAFAGFIRRGACKR
jgi:hypothetical protein